MIVSPLIIVSKIGLYYFLYQVDPNLAYALGCADVGATLKFIHEWAQRKKTFEALMKKAKEAEKAAQGSRLDELYGRDK